MREDRFDLLVYDAKLNASHHRALVRRRAELLSQRIHLRWALARLRRTERP